MSATSANSIPPGSVVGILGGGQLGRMLSIAAARLGMDVHIYAPEADTPAGRVSARSWQAEYHDANALLDFAQTCDVITFEFENVPAATLDALADIDVPVYPDKRALSTSQDRLTEKQFLSSIDVPPAEFLPIEKADDIGPALKKLGGRGVLKLRREGYDGKGQARIETGCDAHEVFEALGRRPCVLEAFIPFESEVSVILARGRNGELAIYDPPKNDHGGGILRQSVVPSGLDQETEQNAKALAEKLAIELGYVGVLALELFVMPDGSLRANEFAPRVHNSGHWTDDACVVNQFEQHIRAICGWPLGDTSRHCDVVMTNLLGDTDIAGWRDLSSNGEAVRIYGKRGGGQGRKLGHANRLTKT